MRDNLKLDTTQGLRESIYWYRFAIRETGPKRDVGTDERQSKIIKRDVAGRLYVCNTCIKWAAEKLQLSGPQSAGLKECHVQARCQLPNEGVAVVLV